MSFSMIFAWALALSFSVFLLGYGIRCCFFLLNPVESAREYDDLE